MARLLAAILIGLVAFGAGMITGYTRHDRFPPLPTPPPTLAEFIAAVRAECDSACTPLRGNWTVGRFEPDVMLGRCACQEPPNIGVGPQVKRPKIAGR